MFELYYGYSSWYHTMTAKMESSLALLFLIVPAVVLGASFDPLNIHQPSIDLLTEQNGFISLQSGNDGDVKVQLHNNNDTGSIFFDGEDLLYIIQIIESQPPFWQSHGPTYAGTPYGYLGNFYAGNVIRIKLSAVDPEGMPIAYSLVAGNFPPGIKLDSLSGQLSGIVPDADAEFVFTIRATDGHMKYADNVFKMVVRGYDRCVDKTTCRHEGVCHDKPDGFTCSCVPPFGDKQCNTDCRSAPLGISTSSKKVSDAQIAGYHMYSSNTATQGRLGGGSAWVGLNESSYMQVDFGDICDIYRIDTRYVTTHYYVNSLYIQYSLDGNSFATFTDYTGKVLKFTASSTSTQAQTFQEVLTARYVRLFPLNWDRSYRPAFQFEMYGCHSNNN